jgi:hypothetical protein
VRNSTIVAIVTCIVAIVFGACCLVEGLMLNPVGPDVNPLGGSPFLIPGFEAAILGTVGLVLVWGTRDFPRTERISVCVAVSVAATVMITTALWLYISSLGFGST